jgi:hypothetical protein
MQADSKDGIMAWQIKGTPLNADVLSTFTKKVFAALIRVLNGEAEIDDSFEFDSSRPVPTSTLDFGKVPKRPGYEEEFQLQRPDTPGARPAVAASNPAPAASRSQEFARPESSPTPAPAEPAASPAAVSSSFASAGVSSGTDITPPDQRLTQNGQTVEAAINSFGRLIDQELDALTTLGVKAMQSQDIVFVQKTIKRQAALKSFREKTIAFAQEWHAAMRE